MTKYFFKRDNNKKIRIVKLNLIENNSESYTISGETGIFNGKLIPRPAITITKGKVKRTVKEQAELQFNSIVLSYLDKGYKTSDILNIININDSKEIESKVPNDNTDQNGIKKPMLCKVYDINDSKNKDVTSWYLSAKHDGLRCFLYYKDGVVKTASRGGQHYDVAATYICQDPYINKLFKSNPNLILDGELYKHDPNWNLQRISGLGRLETLHEDHKQLQFYCYDIVDETKIFSERYNTLMDISRNCPSNSKLIIVSHTIVKTHNEIMKLHDNFVLQGYEGAVIRDGSKEYKCGARDRRMQKIKLFSDDEFEITGITEGLREEDFVFNLKTKEGYTFEAKPIGSREVKKKYREMLNSLIGTMGTVKFFGYTNTSEPVPNLPVFICPRIKKDIE